MSECRPTPDSQNGAILLVSLILLLIMTIVGVAIISSGTLQEQMAANLQLVTTNRQAAQTAASAFLVEGSVVFNDSLSNSANIGTQILREAIDRGNPGPGATNSANALVHCITSDGSSINRTDVTDQDCIGATNNFSAAAVPTKSRRRAFYTLCAPILGVEGMAMSLDQGLGIANFYVEGAGFLDLDANGLPPAAGNEESVVYEHQWMRWKRPIPCES